jgi:phosphotransferase system HPr (HPr) family protein
MKRQRVELVVADPMGIHGRPAGALAIAVAKSGARVKLHCGAKSADAASVIALLSLGARAGSNVIAEIEGDDAAISSVERALEEMFAKPSG